MVEEVLLIFLKGGVGRGEGGGWSWWLEVGRGRLSPFGRVGGARVSCFGV